MKALSILIPVFNWDSSQLIKDLHFQGLELGIPYEIIIADDCSTDRSVMERNREQAVSLENCRFIALEHNLGRAAIRNFLADQSKYDKLLFMDCDAAVRDSQFLKRYVDAADKAQVVCGGAIHSDEIPQKGVELRWVYEKNADKERSAEFRSRNPYARFTPFSFLIDKEVFMQIRFDESYSGYGYEDVQFGSELEKRGVSIMHIDNQLIHLGLEKSDAYLEKTRQAVVNAFEHREMIADSSLLLTHYNRVARFRMKWLFRFIWKVFGKKMEKNLLGSTPNMRIFSLYKLCYICIL
jgi:glycosyltransferase involved in cell wall biosynthesis